jgi:hypothetical protein
MQAPVVNLRLSGSREFSYRKATTFTFFYKTATAVTSSTQDGSDGHLLPFFHFLYRTKATVNFFSEGRRRFFVQKSNRSWSSACGLAEVCLDANAGVVRSFGLRKPNPNTDGLLQMMLLEPAPQSHFQAAVWCTYRLNSNS